MNTKPLTSIEKYATVFAIIGGLALFAFFAARGKFETKPTEEQSSQPIVSTTETSSNKATKSLLTTPTERTDNALPDKLSTNSEATKVVPPETEATTSTTPKKTETTNKTALASDNTISANAHKVATSELAKLREENKQQLLLLEAQKTAQSKLRSNLASMRKRLSRNRENETRLSKEIARLRNLTKNKPDASSKAIIAKLLREKTAALAAVRLLEENNNRAKAEWNARIRELEMANKGKLSAKNKPAFSNKSDLTALAKENEQLREELAKFRSKEVFARSAADLSPKHGKLFTRLQGLEKQSSDALKTTYENLPTEIGATRVARVQFSSGSITVTKSNREKLTAALANAPAGSSFLIIGYASKKGDSDINESLSSKRATAVARETISTLGSKHKVKAVYLGETKRFGSTSANQVVEIWQVK